jgi:hypothetical protein
MINYFYIIFNAIKIIFLLYAFRAQAQSGGSPVFTHFSLREGLPDRTVYDVIQGRDGYIWLATDRGICRFDGYEFWLPPGPPESIGSAFHLKEDSRGRIWYHLIDATLWHFDGDSIRPWRYNDVVQKYRGQFDKPDQRIQSEDGEKLWISLRKLGVLEVSESGRDTLYVSPDTVNNVSLFVQAGKIISAWRHLGVPAKTKCMPHWYYADKKWRRVDACFITVVNSCTALSDGTFVVYGYDDGFYSLRDGEIIGYSPFKTRTFVNIQQTASDDIFFGVFDGEKGVLHYKNAEALRRGQYNRYLQGYQVTSVCMDRAGGLWISTHEDGIFYAANPGARVWDTRHGLLYPMVRNLAAGEAGVLYLGLRNGALQGFQRGTGTWQRVPMPADDIHYNTDMAFDPQRKRLWIATDAVYYRQEGLWKRLPVLYPGERPGVCLAKKITFSKDYGQVFLPHSNYISLNNDTELRPSTVRGLAPNKRCLLLYEDPLRRRWLSTQQTLYRLTDAGLTSMEQLHPIFGKRGPVCIAEFQDTLLVFGFRTQGLLLWGPDSQFIHLKPGQGLPAGVLNHLCDDGRGRLWAATTLGLAKIFRNSAGQWATRTFTTAHGLPDFEVQDIVPDSGGVLWLATAAGLCRFREPDTSTSQPKPFLRELSVNGTERAWGEGQTFTHRENNLNIRFLTLNFRQFGKIQYRYRLREKAAWRVTDHTSVDFPQLVPGNYRFELQSQDEEGRWSESCVWDFYIAPPWWAHWWFRLGVVLALGAAGYFWYRSRLRSIKTWAALQRQRYDLERAALQAQMNPHFIFNCLNSIQQFIQQNDREQAMYYLGHFARLVRDTLEASVRGKVALEDELRMLRHYLDLEKLRFKGHFDYRIETDLDSDPSDLVFPPLLIQPIVENAIVHGMRNLDRPGFIEVSFQETATELVVRVRDNGHGLPEQDNGNRPEAHTPIATGITARRLALLQKPGSQELLQRHNLLDDEGRVMGMEAVLRIGLG